MHTRFTLAAAAAAAVGLAGSAAAQQMEHAFKPTPGFAQLTGATKSFSFPFVRATNLPSPATGHVHHLTVTLQDQNHFTQEWTWQEKGKGHTEVFRFARKS